MFGLPNLEEVRSISKFGLSQVTVVFAEGTDIYFARQQVQERLQQAREQIPEGYGTPEMGPISTGLGEIFQYSFATDARTARDTAGHSATELRTLQDWVVAPQLRAVRLDRPRPGDGQLLDPLGEFGDRLGPAGNAGEPGGVDESRTGAGRRRARFADGVDLHRGHRRP